MYKRAVCGGAHLGPNSLEAEAGDLQREFQDGQRPQRNHV